MLALVLAQADTAADAGKAVALALGIGLGSLGAGIGIGNIFGSMIQSVAVNRSCAVSCRESCGSGSRSPRQSSSTA